MEEICLSNLRVRLQTLTVFRGLLADPVILSLCEYLDNPAPDTYAEFVSKLYEANGGKLDEYVKYICGNNENVYVRAIGCGNEVEGYVQKCVEEELKTLQIVSELTVNRLRKPLEWNGFLPEFVSGNIDIAERFNHRVQNIGKYGYGVYAKNKMFYIDENTNIVPVSNPDTTRLSELVDYEIQRKKIIDNTKALLAGKPAANVLLTGDAGTGKSSTIKAIVNELYAEGLRIIEVRKDQLRAIIKILDELATNPLKFILFIDDLSFLKDDDNFNALKAVLEGSVSAKSKNVVIYATSNRRHIIKESFSERDGDDVHRNDTMQELVSLSERFGMHITFSKPNKDTFLHIVHHIADEKGLSMDSQRLEAEAERFALERGGRSARLARQFVDSMLSV